MLVFHNVHMLPIPGRNPLLGSNVFMVGNDKELAILDPGNDFGYTVDTAVHSIMAYLGSLGNPRVKYIIVSHAHPDHSLGCIELRKNTRAKVVTHIKEAPRLAKELKRRKIDVTVKNRDIIEVGSVKLRVVHSPGHTPGHICLYMFERGIFFSGDNVVGHGTTAINPPEGDMMIYLDSLRKIRDMKSRIICPGHGPIITDPAAKLKELIDHRMMREKQVLKQLRGGITDTRTMMERIYIPENIPKMFYDWAEKQIVCHLQKLEKEGRAVAYQEGEKTKYKPARGKKKK